MYTTQACSEPNSASPISAAAIAQQNAQLAAAAAVFDNGDTALNDLISALGGNAAGTGSAGALQGGAGVPTGATLVPNPSGAPGLVWAAPPSSGFFPPQPYYSWGGGRNGGGFKMGAKNCALPEILPLVTVFPVPAAAPVVAPAPINPSPVAAAAPVSPADCAVNADTICQAIQSGCVLSSQVSAAQLAACSRAGWVGNYNQYPALAARGGSQGGRYFGDVNLNPAPPRGVSGLGDTAAAPSPWCFNLPGVTSLPFVTSSVPGAVNTCDAVALPGLASLFGSLPLWGVGLSAAALLYVFTKKGRR